MIHLALNLLTLTVFTFAMPIDHEAPCRAALELSRWLPAPAPTGHARLDRVAQGPLPALVSQDDRALLLDAATELEAVLAKGEGRPEVAEFGRRMYGALIAWIHAAAEEGRRAGLYASAGENERLLLGLTKVLPGAASVRRIEELRTAIRRASDAVGR